MSETVNLNMLDPDLQRLLKAYAAAPERDLEAARRTRSGFMAELDRLFTPQTAPMIPRGDVAPPARPSPVTVPPRKPLPLPGRRVLSYVLGAVLVLVVFLSSSAGITAYAAGGSLPGDPLYSVKITTENLRARWTPDPAAQAQLYLNFAERRLIEIRDLIRESRFDDVDRAVIEFERDMQKFVAALGDLAQTRPAQAVSLKREAVVLLRSDEKVLAQLLMEVPGEAQSPLRGVLHTLESAAYSLDAGDDRADDGVLGGRGGRTDCTAGSAERDDDRCGEPSQPSGEPIIQTPAPPTGDPENNDEGRNTGDDSKDDDNGDDDDDDDNDDDDDD